ncbi:MAG TPA: penicillin-binding protein 2 [Candidatus Nanopelagicales bacterium]|nr:penicillin-binding protein 2 [Candidatus Nanopelagicales bacterium]
MSERSTLRLAVLGVLVLSLLVTMVARLFFLQVVSADTYAQQASDNNKRYVYTPATRGLILDQLGRPLVANRTSLVVSVDRTVLQAEKDKGVGTIARLAKALGTTPTALSYRLETCGPQAHAKPPICWNGSPFQPVPVAKDISQALALTIMEKRSLYPGVTAGLEAVREYESPYKVNAAHLLGYIGPVSDQELADQKAEIKAGTLSADDPNLLRSTSIVGRAGLEAEYDAYLRGTPGVKTLLVDQAAHVVGTAGETEAQPGSYLVTNIDSRLQSVVETQLLAAITRARGTTEKSTGKKYKADSGAAVVLDVTNGHVLAMASYPSYDPSVWVGGISQKEYAGLTGPTSNYPLISRATQGQFVPASTFKIVSASAALQNGYSAYDTYKCPSYIMVGNRKFSNFEGEAPGDVNLAKGLAVSCDTMWYQIAYDYWLRDGGNTPVSNPKDPIEKMAKAFGYGKQTGIDLPSETRGRVGGRAFKTALNEQLHDAWCQRAVSGYPEVAKTDPARANYLKALAKENCADGGVYRGGDEVNLAIGQGDTVVTPLQVATAYAALANGGTLWAPQVAKGVVSSSGKVLKLFKPKSDGRLPVSAANLAFLRQAFSDVTSKDYGTGHNPFKGFPLAQIPVAAKTGTGQASNGQQSTSWFATFAPANKPKYAVVMMVSQGGTGAGTSAPSVRKIYEAIYGITGSTIDPKKSVLAGGQPSAKMPTVRADGTPVYPGMPTSITAKSPATAATPASTAQSDAATPNGTSSAGLVALPVLFGVGLVGRRSRRSRDGPRWWSR